MQVQQAGTQIIGLEGPARVKIQEVRLLKGEDRAGWAAVHDRAMLVLMMEAAAARRRRGLLPGPAWWGGGNAPGQERWWVEDPQGDAVLLTQVQMERQMPALGGAQPSAHNPSQQPDLASDLFELQHVRPQPKRQRSPKKNQVEPEHRLGLYGMGLAMAGKGARGHASELSRSEQIQTTHGNRAQEGRDSIEDCRCKTQNVMAESCQRTPNTQPG